MLPIGDLALTLFLAAAAVPVDAQFIQQAVVARGRGRSYRSAGNDTVDSATGERERACLAHLAHVVFKDELVLAGAKIR